MAASAAAMTVGVGPLLSCVLGRPATNLEVLAVLKGRARSTFLRLMATLSTLLVCDVDNGR